MSVFSLFTSRNWKKKICLVNKESIFPILTGTSLAFVIFFQSNVGYFLCATHIYKQIKANKTNNKVLTQPTFTYSKSSLETPEQRMTSVQI